MEGVRDYAKVFPCNYDRLFYQKTLRIASNIAYIYEHILVIYFHLCSVVWGFGQQAVDIRGQTIAVPVF